LHMVQVLPDPFEEPRAPTVSTIIGVPLLVPRVLIAVLRCGLHGGKSGE
jgi:hypothetical protein